MKKSFTTTRCFMEEMQQKKNELQKYIISIMKSLCSDVQSNICFDKEPDTFLFSSSEQKLLFGVELISNTNQCELLGEGRPW